MFQSHYTANLLPSAIFENSRFFSKNQYIFFLEKNPNFESFENFHYFSRIVLQTCNNLMKQIQAREQPMLARLRESNSISKVYSYTSLKDFHSNLATCFVFFFFLCTAVRDFSVWTIDILGND